MFHFEEELHIRSRSIKPLQKYIYIITIINIPFLNLNSCEQQTRDGTQIGTHYYYYDFNDDNDNVVVDDDTQKNR